LNARIQPLSAIIYQFSNGINCLLIISFGVLPFLVFLGRLLSKKSTSFISLLLTLLKLVPLGKNCQIRPFVFSLIPRSQEEYGLQIN